MKKPSAFPPSVNRAAGTTDEPEAAEATPRPKSATLPKIEHERYRLPGTEGQSIKEVVIERRGLRDYVRREYHDRRLTVGEAVLNSVSPSAVFDALFDQANEVLRTAKERPLGEALEVLQDEELTEDQRSTAKLIALGLWKGGIVERHGQLSVEAIAAEYLIAANRIYTLLSRDRETLDAVCSLCEAWHWHHLEAAGEHALAVAGMKAAKGRAAAAPVAKVRSTMRRQIVELEYDAYCSRESRPNRRTASIAADAILDSVNARLAEHKVGSFTAGSLRKVLGEVIKAKPTIN